MMMVMENNLINITDIQKIRRIDPKFNNDRLGTFIQQAQRINLRGLLGDKLYADFMNDERISGKYGDLLNGKQYNGITYYGLKDMLSYWVLAILSRESDMFQSNVGAIQFANNTQQNFESSKEKERIAAGYMETATQYANDTINYLNYYSSDYPLWKSAQETNKTNFVSFRL